MVQFSQFELLKLQPGFKRLVTTLFQHALLPAPPDPHCLFSAQPLLAESWNLQTAFPGRQEGPFLMTSYYASHLSPKCHLTGGMRRQHRPTLFQRESGDLKLQTPAIPESFAYVLQRTKTISLHKSLTKILPKPPRWHPLCSASFPCMSSKTASQGRTPGTVTFASLQEPRLEEHSASISVLVLGVAISGNVRPAHTTPLPIQKAD